MTRALKPCGTYAAYRRHLRAKESPCEECRQAARDQKNVRKDAARKEAAVRAVEATPPVEEEIDRRAILLEVLASLRGQLREAPPQSAGSIAKQIRDTLDALEGPDEKAQAVVNPVDEIAKRRAERAKLRGEAKRIATSHS